MSLRHFLGLVLRFLFPKSMELRVLKKKHKVLRQAYELTKDYSEKDWLDKLIRQYEGSTGHKLDIQNPKRFTEKIQWRKIYDINPVYALLSDKYRVREWVAKKIGEKYLIPLIAAYDNIKELDYSKLPDKFVIKTNNACGTNMIIKDKRSIEKKRIKENYDFWMSVPYGYNGVERHYDCIQPKIIVEKYLEPDADAGNSDLTDYKFFCFGGKPQFCQIISNRNSDENIDFYDMDWQRQEYQFNSYGNLCGGVAKPQHLEEMKMLAGKLSVGFAFVRVDFYQVFNQVYFGEMTFTPASGYNSFSPDEWDYKLGDLWNLDIPQVDHEAVGL